MLIWALTSIWITLSVSIIFLNKYLLSVTTFKFPICLAMCHMACNFLCCAAIFARKIALRDDPPNLIVRISVGVLFGIVLWSANAAFIHLSIPFIQMLKAFGPVCILVMSAVARISTITLMDCASVLLILIGLTLSAIGEISFDAVGFFLQSISIIADSLRCVLLQVALQQTSSSALTTLYYTAPFAFMSLSVPFVTYEYEHMLKTEMSRRASIVLLAGCVVSVALNITVFMLIKHTSALTTSVSGVLKEIICITAAMFVFGTRITPMQVGGYAISMAGLLMYRYSSTWCRPM
jgi:drug/metabolite transporter (DMT)-like permease